MLHIFHISLYTNLPKMWFVKFCNGVNVLGWKRLIWELPFNFCVLLMDMNDWVDEWMGRWMNRSFEIWLPFGHLRDRGQSFRSGCLPLFGAASSCRLGWSMGLWPGIYIPSLLLSWCAWHRSISITSIASDNMNKRWLVWRYQDRPDAMSPTATLLCVAIQ